MTLLPHNFFNYPKKRKEGESSWDSLFSGYSDLLPAFFDEGRSQGLSVSSDENKVYIEAAIPGLNAKDIDVSLDEDGLLWIKGEKKEEEEDKQRHYYRKSQRNFSYCVPLGNEVDLSAEPEAECKDGVMRLAFPRQQEKRGKGRKINVK